MITAMFGAADGGFPGNVRVQLFHVKHRGEPAAPASCITGGVIGDISLEISLEITLAIE